MVQRIVQAYKLLLKYLVRIIRPGRAYPLLKEILTCKVQLRGTNASVKRPMDLDSKIFQNGYAENCTQLNHFAERRPQKTALQLYCVQKVWNLIFQCLYAVRNKFRAFLNLLCTKKKSTENGFLNICVQYTKFNCRHQIMNVREHFLGRLESIFKIWDPFPKLWAPSFWCQKTDKLNADMKNGFRQLIFFSISFGNSKSSFLCVGATFRYHCTISTYRVYQRMIV